MVTSDFSKKRYSSYAFLNRIAKWRKEERDAIWVGKIGHSLKGMDAHYIVLSDESLREAMDQHTLWLDEKIDEADELLKNAVGENESNSR